MTRWPIRAILASTALPTAITTPQGSWPAMTGPSLTGMPVACAGPWDGGTDAGRCRTCRTPSSRCTTSSSLRPWIRKLHQFQPAFAREYNAPHGFLRPFLLWPDFEPKRQDWQSANRLRAGVTKDQGVPFPAFPPRLTPATATFSDLAHKDPAQASDRQAAVLQDDRSGSVP